jgi:hypothetical protein
MNTNTSKSENLTWHLQQYRLPSFALGIAVCSVAIYAAIDAPAMWATAERVKAEQIEQEDREYCDKFRMPFGSENFAACAADLAEVRRRERDRTTALEMGL